MRKFYNAFWDRNPALFVGLSILLGASLAFNFHYLFIILFILLSLTAKSKRMLCFSALCFCSAFCMAYFRNPTTVIPEKQKGIGTFHIEQVKNYSSPFHKSILYKGTLKQFETENGIIFKKLPCNIYFPQYGKRPPADTDYKIQGTLSQKGEHAFVLKPEKNSIWIPIPTHFSLSEWRYAAKQTVSSYLKKHIADPRARTFLCALATGEIDERILSLEFGKIGLQHILAISGFHFALAALFLNFLFRLFFPHTISAIFFIVAISCYYLFLGNAPSIQRAYIAILLFAIGQLFSLKISGLNALGAGLIIELLIDPLVVTELSFQFTFLCTLAILLFYPLANHALMPLFPARSYSDTQSMSLLDKHGCLFSALLRKMLALNLAVHIISIPVILYLFHKFPLLSFDYNLIFPACVTLSMLLLFVALFFAPFIPFLSHAIHVINNAWTSTILNFSTNPPAFLDFAIRTKSIELTWVLCFLAAAFFSGIIFYEKERQRTIA